MTTANIDSVDSIDRSLPSVEPMLVTVADAKALLSLSHVTIYKLLQEKKLRAVKIGRATRITLESVKALATAA